MRKEDCFELGHITKTTGYSGVVTAFFDVDEPEYYRGLDIVLIDLKEGLIPFMIESLEYRGKRKFRMQLEGIDDLDQAEALVKRRLFLPLAALPSLEGKQFYYHEVIGWKIIDQSFGEVGIIRSINDNQSNPLIVVEHGDKEVLLPLNDDFLISVDRESQNIVYNAPEGLIELFLEEESGDGPSENS